MNRIRKNTGAHAVIATGLAIVLATLTACGGGDVGPSHQSNQQPWSELSPEQRAATRGVLYAFQSQKGLRPGLNVLKVLKVINDEAERVLVSPGEKSYVVDNQSLELFAPEVLPEFDANGFYDPTGGFEPFHETVISSSNHEERNTDVHKAVRTFSSGSLSRVNIEDTVDTPADYEQYTAQVTAYQIDAAVAYQESLNTQQVETDRVAPTADFEHNQNFYYPSRNTEEYTLEENGRTSRVSFSEDKILSQQGWDHVSGVTVEADLKGTITLFRPAFVEQNTRPEAPETPSGGRPPNSNSYSVTETVITPEDQRCPDANTSGFDDELILCLTTTRSEDLTENYESADQGARMTRQNILIHESTVYSYKIKEGDCSEGLSCTEYARRYNSLAFFPDYVETTRDETNISYAYDGQITTTTTTTTNLRYTDNPRERNNIDNWRCVSRQVIVVDNQNTTTFTTDDSGEVWLTDMIEVDSDVSQMAWGIKGKITNATEHQERYFGDNLEGLEWREVETHALNATFTWGDDEVQISGAITNRKSAINAPGDHTKVKKLDQGDWDGSLSATVGGQSYTLSAEEWKSLAGDLVGELAALPTADPAPAP